MLAEADASTLVHDTPELMQRWNFNRTVRFADYAAGGGPRTDGTALPGDGGYVLHAERLVFAHPVSGKAMALPATRPVEPRTATEP